MVNMARELRHIQRKGYDFVERTTGEGVMWYEFNAKASQLNDVYDEGGRLFRPGIAVQALWCSQEEDPEEASPTGRRVTPSLRLAVSMQTLRLSGVSEPGDERRHLNDVVLYRRTFWEVGGYNILGRLDGHDVVVGVSCGKTFPVEDMILDTVPDSVDTARPQGAVNDRAEYWPNHELPAQQEPEP